MTRKLLCIFVPLAWNATGAQDRPAPPPVEDVGRVKSRNPVNKPPLPICESARVARARNSPAARGLEEKCAALLAAQVTTTASAGGAISATQPDNTIRVQVKYRKELGYKADSGAFGPVGPTSCAAFSVSASVSDTTTRRRNPTPISSDAKMIESGDYYVCSYLVSEIPFDRTVSISVGMAGPDGSSRWRAGTMPEPPPGQLRTVVDATRTTLLNSVQPRARLSYEMVYAPAPRR